jgi:hypothetical protein
MHFTFMTLSDFEVRIVRVMTPMKWNEKNKIMEEVTKIIRNQRILLLLVAVVLV